MAHRVYCSGPLFCPEERAGMLALAEALEAAGFETFLPQRDGIERHLIGRIDSVLADKALGVRGLIDGAVFALDVFQLVEGCDAAVVNLNGRVPDEGAAVEAGIAFAVGKPVVLYKRDDRSAFHGGDNAMLLGLSRQAPVARLAELPRAVAARLAERAAAPGPLPAPLAQTVARGRRVQRILEALPRREPDAPLVRDLLARLKAADAEEA